MALHPTPTFSVHSVSAPRGGLPRRRRGRTCSALAVAVLLCPLMVAAHLALLPAEAQAQTPYQAYQDRMSDERNPGGVQFEMARGGGLLLGHKRGGMASLLAGGMSVFTLEAEATMLWHNHGGQDHRYHQVRLLVGMTAIELYDLASWRLEVGLVFGERMRGERGYTELGLGTTVSLPLWYGPDGWPILRAEFRFGVSPPSKIFEAFRQESSLSVYPFLGTGMRSLGLQGGFLWGLDDDEPYHLIYFGVIFGAPLG